MKERDELPISFGSFLMLIAYNKNFCSSPAWVNAVVGSALSSKKDQIL